MNYWPAYVTNLLEAVFPVINYVDDLRVYGRLAAVKYAGIVSQKVRKMVGWFILKRLPLVGRHLVGITIGVGHQLPMRG